MKGREAMEAKMGEMKRAGAVLNSQARVTGRPVTHPVDRLVNAIIFVKKGKKL